MINLESYSIFHLWNFIDFTPEYILRGYTRYHLSFLLTELVLLRSQPVSACLVIKIMFFSCEGPPQLWNDENAVAYQVFPPCSDFFSPDSKCGETNTRKKRQAQVRIFALY